jgi:putative glutamine amidotransferase
MSQGNANRPVLGITACNREFGEESAQLVFHRYVEAASIYADAAILIIPSRPDLMTAAEIADRIDGLLLTGSPSNIAPQRYASTAADEGPSDAGRDEMSLGMIEALIARKQPVFGICRGFQEINVAFGGSLARDLGAGDRPLSHHAPDTASFDEMFAHGHDVELTPGGVLERALGAPRLGVNSVHFQGVDRLGAGLSVEAIAPDGVVEAVSANVDGAPVLGVQWHPEWHATDNPASQVFFRLLGHALRDEAYPDQPIASDLVTAFR